MNSYIQGLLAEYGKRSGISVDEISLDNFRYRFREVPGAPGLWIPESEAVRILEETRKEVQDENFRQMQLEDAFGPDDLHNPPLDL